MSPLRVFSLILLLVIGVSTFLDARKKGQSALLPLIFLAVTFVFPIALLALPVLFLLRGSKTTIRSGPKPHTPQLSTKMCSKCGHENSPGYTECANCHNTLAL